MRASIIPLKTIFFQILFLLIQITIESTFIYKFLSTSRQKSLEYSIPLNLFANFLGWLIFFIFVPLANQTFQFQLMNFILFNKLPPHPELLILMFIIVVFALALTLKILTFMFLEKFNKSSATQEITTPKKTKKPRYFSLSSKKSTRKYQVIIWGHSLSHVIILLILILIQLDSQ